MPRAFLLCLPLALLVASGATAQLSGLSGLAGGSKGLGGLGGLTGGMPNLGSVGMGNATGVLSYCVKNKLLRQQQTIAGGVLGKLTGKEPAVESTPGFLDGQKGLLNQGGGNTLSLDSLPSGIKAKACDMVLSKAQSFL